MKIAHVNESLLQKGLKLSHLRILAAFAETEKISLAADRIGVTQPAASRLLAEIEQIAGSPVHGKTGRGVALTQAGRALADRAQRILIELHHAARDIAEVSSGGVGQVRIGSVTGPAMDRVLPVLRITRLEQPSVIVEVIVATSDVLVEHLLSGRIDFALGRPPEGEDGTLVETRLMSPEVVSLVVRRGHPLQKRPDLVAADLLGFDWVLPGPESLMTRVVLSRLQALGLPKPQQRLFTSSFLLTLALVQQSNAIAPLASAVADTFATGPDTPYFRLPLDLGMTVEPFGLMTRAGIKLPPAAQHLAERILAQIP